MPIDISKVLSRSRTVNIDGIGPVVVREPTLGDAERSTTDRYWWLSCVSCPDGSPLLEHPQDAARLRHDIAAALMNEVNTIRPTHGPSADHGASAPTNSV